jgi:hypothetical protein
MPARPAAPRARPSPFGLVAALLGLILFAYTVRQTGLQPIAEGLRRVGAGFLIILLLSGLRFWVRARAWTLATDRPSDLPVRDTFAAFVAGDALGNLTPLGLFASEPAKAAFVRSRVTLLSAFSGIAVENLLYTLTVALVIAAGTAALLSLFPVPRGLQAAALAALLGVLVVVAAGAIVLARQIRLVSGALAWLERRNRAPARLVARLARLRELEDQIYGFAGRHPERLLPILALETSFHALGVAEVWVTLSLLAGADAPTLLTTFVLESVNRTVMVAFKFVPLRLGVDEAGTEALTRTLGLTTGVGVTMAIVRKVRMLVWAGVGVGVLVRRGLVRTA